MPLIGRGAAIDARDSESGSTALYLAASWGRRDVAAFLLSRGADPNARNKDGVSPLAIALKNLHPEVAELLRTRGAKE
jgi:ankyrin repeat protein